MARLQQNEFEAIRFGDEGQYWRLMRVSEYLAEEQAVGYLQERLRHFLAGRMDIA